MACYRPTITALASREIGPIGHRSNLTLKVPTGYSPVPKLLTLCMLSKPGGTYP